MINVDKYESLGFHNWQIEEIKLAIKNGVNEDLIKQYMENVDLDNLQLQQIRLGLQQGLDVSLFARKDIPYSEMETIRLKQLEEKLKVQEDIDKKQKEIIKQENKIKRKSKLENIRSVLVIFLIVFLISILGVIGYLFRDSIVKSLQILELNIPTDVIELNYGDDFNAEDYVLKATDGDDIVKIYPTYFDTNKLGEFELEYVITNNVRSLKRILRVNVVDKISPTLELTKDQITLTRTVDDFNAEDYIKEVSDNYDDDPKLEFTELDRSKNSQEIKYLVTDSSGNYTEKMLKITIKDKPKPVVNPTNNNSNNNQNNNSNNQNNNNSSSNSNSNTNQNITPSPAPTPAPAPQPKPQNNSYITASSISVKVGTSIGDVQAMLVGGISSSSGYSIDFSQVNTSAPGTYTVYVSGDDGASTTCTVTVTE